MMIDDIYMSIAQDISSAIEDDWSVARIQFELAEDAGEFDCTYHIGEDLDTEYDFDISFDSYKAFKKLHSITTENGSNKWNRAKFTLYPTGKFHIDFEWDQSLADEIEANS